MELEKKTEDHGPLHSVIVWWWQLWMKNVRSKCNILVWGSHISLTVQRGSMGIQLMWIFKTNKWLGIILQIELLELTYIFWPEKVSVHLYLPIWCTPRSQINKWRVFLDFFLFTWPFSLLIWCEALLCIWEIIINKQMMIGSLIWFVKHNFD